MTQSRQTDLVGTSHVNSHDLVPHLLIHINKRLVPENTRIGDEDVNSTESIDSGFDDSITIFGGTDGRDSLTSD